MAGAIGLLLVVLFMAIYYRLPGVIADLALLVYAATTFALFKLIPVTLTLPGIAGFVLSIGVAVDANILIFSRLKEELRAGKALRPAIDLAWSRAWPSIRDFEHFHPDHLLHPVLVWQCLWRQPGERLCPDPGAGRAGQPVHRHLRHPHLPAPGAGQPEVHRASQMVHGRTAPNTTEGQPAMLDIIGQRYLYFAISLMVIIPGLLALLAWGLPLAIDFTGGSLLEVSFAGTPPNPAQVIQLYQDLGVPGAQVQSSTGNLLMIRSRQIDETMKDRLVAEMGKRFQQDVTLSRFDTVGPSISKEVAGRAAGAVALASLGILIYITFAFRGVPHAFRFGTAAILAMLHDVAVVLGMAALLGHFLHWEVDSLFLTALLTVIGFSVHDTIVVFDRIRENANLYRRQPFTDHCQPLDRADPRPLDQHPADRDAHPDGAGPVRRRDHPYLCHHPADRRLQRHLLLHLQRRADPGGVGEPRVAQLVQTRPGRSRDGQKSSLLDSRWKRRQRLSEKGIMD